MNTASMISSLVQSVTKPWAKQRKAEERQANARTRRYETMTRNYRESIKDVAWEIMEQAYLKASSDGKLPAHARQIMYAARGEIQERTGKQLDDQYFTQTLLPDYIIEHPEAQAWDVVFDARGHFREPHTDRIIPLGTIDVQGYLGEIQGGGENGTGLDAAPPRAGRFPTAGPQHRYGGILFIEKEGFMPLFKEVQLAERYDLAIMSTKGMSVTASRLLIDRLSAGGADLPVFVLHDFDKAGFSILGTLQHDTRRYTFQNEVRVIDLGIRIRDVNTYKLESEDVYYGHSDPTENLRENGATDHEIGFLCGFNGSRGKRVELNAFTSGDLVQWIEVGLKKHGVKKVIPDEESLEAAYRRALEIELLNKEIEKIRKGIRERAEEAPLAKGLRRRVERRLKADPALAWDQAIAEEVRQRLEDAKAANKKASPGKGRVSKT